MRSDRLFSDWHYTNDFLIFVKNFTTIFNKKAIRKALLKYFTNVGLKIESCKCFLNFNKTLTFRLKSDCYDLLGQMYVNILNPATIL